MPAEGAVGTELAALGVQSVACPKKKPVRTTTSLWPPRAQAIDIWSPPLLYCRACRFSWPTTAT